MWAVWAERGTGTVVPNAWAVLDRWLVLYAVQALPARMSICGTGVPTANMYMYTWTGRLVPRLHLSNPSLHRSYFTCSDGKIDVSKGGGKIAYQMVPEDESTKFVAVSSGEHAT